MSGEAAKADSVESVSLKDHFDELLQDRDRLLDERYATQTKAVDAAFAAAKEAVTTALESAEKAVGKAEAAADKRFESVNEFRQTLSDQAATFMPRHEADQRFTALAEKVDLINSRLDITAGGTSGADKFRTSLIALVGSAVAIVGLIAALLTR